MGKMVKEEFKKRVIYKCYVGSIAHGLYMSEEEFGDMATCDIDTMEFFTYPLEYYYSMKSLYEPTRKLTFVTKEGEMDVVGHELRKGIDLLIKGNPNMLVMLFIPPESRIMMDKEFSPILDNADLFLSKRNVLERFKGYAHDQISRLVRGVFNGYMGEKRKEIVRKFGYDTKNAMTCIRLMHEAIEALESGRITVDKRVNGMRDYFLDIKLGKWSLDKVKSEAELLFKKADEVAENSSLPQDVDYKKLKELVNSVMKRILVDNIKEGN